MERTKSEVLRYLGRKGHTVPPDLDGLVDECIALMREAAVFRQIHLTFPISMGAEGIEPVGTGLILRGKDITRHLSGCWQAVLLAATLGAGADALINRWKRVDQTRSLVLDACATQLIEEGCDEIQRQIWAEAASRGLAATGRFSPGYGDLSLEVQPGILEALNAGRRIGLTCTEHYIMLPRKSVTALIGLSENAVIHTGGCVNCNLYDKCGFRSERTGDFDECERMAKE